MLRPYCFRQAIISSVVAVDDRQLLFSLTLADGLFMVYMAIVNHPGGTLDWAQKF
jgi:hypothetical protein